MPADAPPPPANRSTIRPSLTAVLLAVDLHAGISNIRLAAGIPLAVLARSGEAPAIRCMQYTPHDLSSFDGHTLVTGTSK
jgi:hypothetical protein